MDGSGRVTLRNRQFLRKIKPFGKLQEVEELRGTVDSVETENSELAGEGEIFGVQVKTDRMPTENIRQSETNTALHIRIAET